MKKALLTGIAIAALLISLMATACPHPVVADSTDSMFLDSALTISSPANMTYNYRNLTLNVTVPIWSIMGMPNNVSMNYSIDGVYNGPVPLRNITPSDAPPITTKVGMGAGNVDLPELPDGSHCITIFLFGLNMVNYQPQFKSFVYTVYFSIDDPNTIFAPTPSPTTLTPTLTPTLSPRPLPTPSPTPTVSPTISPSVSPTQQPTPTQPAQTATALVPSFEPEPVPLIIYIIAFLIVVFAVAILLTVYLRRTKKQNTISKA